MLSRTHSSLAAPPSGALTSLLANVDAETIDLTAPVLKKDVLRLIQQYLEDEGFMATALTLQDETQLRRQERSQLRNIGKKLKKAITEGDWVEVEKICGKSAVKGHKHFLFRVYRQQYLELIEKQETQKAYTFLSKRLKPLEAWETTPGEFKELCYLLTCRSVNLAGWPGISSGREVLVDEVDSVLMTDVADAVAQSSVENDEEGNVVMPENRLVTLLQQAVAFQVQRSRRKSSYMANVETLLRDFECVLVPDETLFVYRGHHANVLCTSFVGHNGSLLASGSGDNIVRVWNVKADVERHTTRTGDDMEGGGTGVEETCWQLKGHRSRIWSVASNKAGDMLLSASGDGTVRIWPFSDSLLASQFDTTVMEVDQSTVVNEHERDVFAVALHPGQTHAVSAGLDKSAQLFDVRVARHIKTLAGHTEGVTSVQCAPLGGMIVTGSKDKSIQLWDVLSGISLHTLNGHLGEVTSVDFSSDGNYIVSASKDNTVKVWDVRKMESILMLKGYHNTSKNLIRATFGPLDKTIFSGSEDGFVYMWDSQSGRVIERLGGHTDIVYQPCWNGSQGLLASCSHDRDVRVWWARPSL